MCAFGIFICDAANAEAWQIAAANTPLPDNGDDDWDNGNGQPDIWEGYLDENSQVEIKLKEDSGRSILAVDFNYIFGPSNTGEYVWTGEISANPTQAGNWCGGVPINDGTSSILIREDAPNFPYYGAVANLNNMILEHYEETRSSLSKKIITNFEEEIKNFVQVCPKEMINKLKNPITFKTKIKEVS